MFNETSYFDIDCGGLGEASPPYVPPMDKECWMAGGQVYCPPRERRICAPGSYFDRATGKCAAYKAIGPQPIDPGGVTPPIGPPESAPAGGTAPPTDAPPSSGGIDIGGMLGGIPWWVLAIGAYFVFKKL